MSRSARESSCLGWRQLQSRACDALHSLLQDTSQMLLQHALPRLRLCVSPRLSLGLEPGPDKLPAREVSSTLAWKGGCAMEGGECITTLCPSLTAETCVKHLLPGSLHRLDGRRVAVLSLKFLSPSPRVIFSCCSGYRQRSSNRTQDQPPDYKAFLARLELGGWDQRSFCCGLRS